MLVLGLLLILGSAALGAGVAYDGNEAASVEILGTTVDTTAAGIFFTGAATMLVFLLGLWLLRSKLGRDRRKRGERKETRRRQRESVSQIEEERTQLRAENERLSEKLGTRPDSTASSAGETAAEGGTAAPGAHSRADAHLHPAEATSPQSGDGKRG